jgi:hypothetical protein
MIWHEDDLTESEKEHCLSPKNGSMDLPLGENNSQQKYYITKPFTIIIIFTSRV